MYFTGISSSFNRFSCKSRKQLKLKYKMTQHILFAIDKYLLLISPTTFCKSCNNNVIVYSNLTNNPRMHGCFEQEFNNLFYYLISWKDIHTFFTLRHKIDSCNV